MWLWDHDMHRLGFRRKSDRYWWCERRYGLAEGDHVSVFSWSEQAIPTGRSRPPRFLVELTEFHVTMPRGGENFHFYYHEHGENEWQPGGHTSAVEIRRVGCDPAELRAGADVIAAEVAAALGGVLLPRP
jgi:hypothetical protein